LKPTLGKYLERSYLKNTHYKKVVVEWLKIKALSSRPSTEKKKKKKQGVFT
jgi:hypothetical protein